MHLLNHKRNSLELLICTNSNAKKNPDFTNYHFKIHLYLYTTLFSITVIYKSAFSLNILLVLNIMVHQTEFTSHHDFQVIITKIQNLVFGNKWL